MITLRPYQLEAIERTKAALQTHRSTLLQLATGCGKTEIFLNIAKEWEHGRVVVMAHRDFLIRQPAERLTRDGYTSWAIEMGSDYCDDHSFDGRPKIVLTSVQTMCRPKRHQRFDPNDFGLLITDEAHHATARTYGRVIEHFMQNSDLKHIGLTATPKRADGLAMGKVFESVAFEFPIARAIDEGWLVQLRARSIKVDDLDFSSVRSLGGDLNESDLERILTEESHLHHVAAPLVREVSSGLPCLVFCVTVKHAQLLAAIINRYRPNSADYLSGEHTPEQRKAVLDRYARGEVQFLLNCALFLEGFDAPATAAVAMARPTKSRVLYEQVIGRVTRTLPGVLSGLETLPPEARRRAIADSNKPTALVLDFVGNSGKHQLVTCEDILGGNYADPVKQHAKKVRETDETQAGKPVDELLGQAADEVELLRMIEERRRRIKALAEYRVRDVDLMSGAGAANQESRQSDRNGPGGATPKQIGLLIKLGVRRETALKYTKRQASAVISDMLSRR